jgi:hypothetical protein
MTSRKLTAADTPRKGYTTSIDYEVTTSGPQASRVTVESATLPVTSTVFHEVKPHELMRRDMRRKPAQKWVKVDPHEVLRRKFPDEVGELPWHRAIQEVYEQAAAAGQPPAQAVAEALGGVSIATAGRRIRQSKQQLGWG